MGHHGSLRKSKAQSRDNDTSRGCQGLRPETPQYVPSFLTSCKTNLTARKSNITNRVGLVTKHLSQILPLPTGTPNRKTTGIRMTVAKALCPAHTHNWGHVYLTKVKAIVRSPTSYSNPKSSAVVGLLVN